MGKFARGFILSLVLLASAVAGYAQSVNFQDGFEDGDFTQNPVWSGNDSSFIIDSTSLILDGKPNHLLQLRGDTSGVAYLSTPSTNVLGYWEFFINLDFSPSGSNYAEVFLMSNAQNLNGPLNGYAIQAGESGSNDVFRLIRFDGGIKADTLLSGTTDISSGGKFHVKVIRQAGGQWILEVGQGYSGALAPEGSTATDNTYKISGFFGVRVHYTSSRSDKFFFDFKIDPPPLLLSNIRANGNNIDVTFNHAYDLSTVQSSDFLIDHGVGHPTSLSFPSPETVTLQYSNAIPSNKYNITVQNISDLKRNQIADTTTSFIAFGDYEKGDVVINEFMYDPPTEQAEYVEIKNTSDKYLDLQDWQIVDNTASHLTTISTAMVLQPDSLLVLSSDTTSLHNIYGERQYAQVSIPSLNNSGDVIKILSAANTSADSLAYTPEWGGKNIALERRSASAPSVKENFADSPNLLGGTPALPNEVSPDNTPPSLSNLLVNDDQTITLVFSERLNPNQATNTTNYRLNNGIVVGNAQQFAPDSIKLQLTSPLANGTTYQLNIQNQQDIFGNTSASIDTSFTYYKLSKPAKGDIFINEFMYDPPDGATEYIELVNPTSKSFNLQGWTLNNRGGDPQVIINSQMVIPPDSFIVLAPDNTLLTTYPNINLVALGSNWATLRNHGDAIVLHDSAGTLLDSLSYSPDWGGNEQALERRSINVKPVKANFGNNPNGFGSPGSANGVPADKTPPKLTQLQILGSQSLQLTFSEALDKSQTTKKTNFKLSGELSIAHISFSSIDTVQLALDKPLANGTTYQLTIQNQQDIFGNTATSIDTSFTYYKLSPPAKGDIFINEFMYDPPKGQSEYIELYNPTNKSFNLQGWTFNNRGGDLQIIADKQVVIPPDSFVVLAPDQSLLSNYPNINLVNIGSHWATLRNHGDAIILRDSSGMLLDSLNYSPSWGGSGQSLERRSTQVPPVKANFGNNPNGFGSPGSANGVPADQTPPKLNQLQILDNSTLRLIFSEPIAGATATNASNYTIIPAKHIQLIAAARDTITLYLSEKLQSGQQYSVTIHHIQDIFGNTISSSITQHATYIKFSGPQRGDVIINEVLHNGDPEFIELYNPTKYNFDLSGWTINDESSAATFNAGTRLLASAYLVLTSSKPLANRLNNAVYLPNLPNYNNKKDAVYIRNKKGQTIDSLFYTTSFGGNIEGKSSERKDPMDASNDPSNFATSTAASGSTPGTKNSVYQQDTAPPSLIFAKALSGNTFEAQFSEFIKLTKKTRFSVNNQPLTVVTFQPDKGNTIILKTRSPISDPTKLKIKARSLTDVRGNIKQTSTISVAWPAQKGNMVINEIMYDPISSPDDNIPDQAEYIELRNTADYAVSLEGISLHDAPDENGDIRTIQMMTTKGKYIPAGKTALIYADTSRQFSKSRVALFFHLSEQQETSLLLADRTSLSMASSGDAIYLAEKDGETIDSVYYSESWQNPNLASTDGISLERINPEGPSNNPSNWGSSVAELGGTPNQENTLYQKPKQTNRNKIGITPSPNPFSPDGDGYNDRLYISYKLDDSNYLITVEIYDRYGRKVRKLANDKPTGLQGRLIWDGLKDNGRRNRIGIYIIIFKAHDSANGHNKVFKKTVVLARRLN